MRRIIIQNIDGIPDDVLGTIVSSGLPTKGIVSRRTTEGTVKVEVVKGNKSRTYKVWKPYSEDILIDIFTPLPE